MEKIIEEKVKALMFYRVLKMALESDGINKIEVTLINGELQADVVLPKNLADLNKYLENNLLIKELRNL